MCCIQCIITLLLRYQNSFQTIFQIFHYKGNPSGLGGIKISLSQSIDVLQSKLNMFCDQGVKYYTKTTSWTQKNDKSSFLSISTVQAPQPSSENLGLMRYRRELFGHLVSTWWKCKSPQLEEIEWQAWHGSKSVCRGTRIFDHLQCICHLLRPHQHQMMDILCLFNSGSDKLRLLAVAL